MSDMNEIKEALEEAKQQIEYLHNKFSETGSGNAVIARIESAIATLTQTRDAVQSELTMKVVQSAMSEELACWDRDNRAAAPQPGKE